MIRLSAGKLWPVGLPLLLGLPAVIYLVLTAWTELGLPFLMINGGWDVVPFPPVWLVTYVFGHGDHRLWISPLDEPLRHVAASMALAGILIGTSIGLVRALSVFRPLLVTGLIILAYLAFLGWNAYVSNPGCRFTFERVNTPEFGRPWAGHDCYNPLGYVRVFGAHDLPPDLTVPETFTMTVEAMGIFALIAISSIWGGVSLARLWQLRSPNDASPLRTKLASTKAMAGVWGGAAVVGIMVVSTPIAYGELKAYAELERPARVEQLQLEVVGALDMGYGSIGRIFVQGDHAFVVANQYEVSTSDLHVIDVSNPASPTQVGFLGGTGTWAPDDDIFVQGSHAFVTNEWGLRIIDVSNPASPREVGFLNTPGSARGVFVQGSHAFVAAGDEGLRVIDVSDPASPREISSLDTQGYAADVFVQGSHAFVVDGVLQGLPGLQVIDLSNPAAPREVGKLEGMGGSIFVQGNLALVSDEYASGLIDVSNPASPRPMGVFRRSPGQQEVGGTVFVQGNLAFVSDWNARRLRAIDVSDPAFPREVGRLEELRGGVFVQGDLAFVIGSGTGGWGLFVVRFSVPGKAK